MSALPAATPQPFRSFLGNALGLPSVERLYRAARSLTHRDFASSVLEELGVRVLIDQEDLDRIPTEVPVIVVANHPFGLLDGLMLDSVITRVRRDSRVMVNSALRQIPELADQYFWVDILSSGGPARNSRSLRESLDWLKRGGLLAMFPAGEVAHWDFRKARVADPQWSTSAARLAVRTGACVIPAFFDGANSVGFQVVGCIHPMLRTASLARELVNKRGGEYRLRFGAAVTAARLAGYDDPVQATEYLRARTYLLEHRRGPTARLSSAAPRYADAREPVIAAAADPSLLRAELDQLEQAGARIVDHKDYAVYLAPGAALGAVREEVGRLREITFRRVGEGTGKTRDLDRFDEYYHHVVLWDKARNAIAGGYRLAWTPEILRTRGAQDFYTSTLFRYRREFFERLGPAVELGRSFVVPERQKDFAPLLLLWQGIARAVARRPECPVLFGAVSISRDYCAASRELMVRFLRRKERRDLARLVSPRRPVQLRLSRREEIQIVAGMFDDIDGLSEPIRDLESGSGAPVLIRQYLKLGGEIVSFNVDRDFSDVVDALLVVDLRKTDPRALRKYMGPEALARFMAHHSLCETV